MFGKTVVQSVMEGIDWQKPLSGQGGGNAKTGAEDEHE